MVKYYHLDSTDGNHSLIFKVVTEDSKPGITTATNDSLQVLMETVLLHFSPVVYFSYTERIWSSSNILQIPIKSRNGNSPPEILMVGKHGNEPFSPVSLEQGRTIWESLRENGWNDSPF